MLEKTLESPLDNKKIKPVNLKRNQSWIFIGKTDAETPVLWPPDANNRLIGKDSDAGKDWRQEEKGMTEDEIIGIASLTRWAWVWASSKSWWCSPWGHKASDMTERLNWTEVGELWKLSIHIWLGKITVDNLDLVAVGVVGGAVLYDQTPNLWNLVASQVNCIRIDWNYRTHNWCLRIAWCAERIHTLDLVIRKFHSVYCLI